MEAEMTILERVSTAANPKEAMLVIADALDTIIVNMQAPRTETNPWGEWTPVQGIEDIPQVVSDSTAPERSAEWLKLAQQVGDPHRAVEIIESEDASEVVIRPPSAEKRAARAMVETQQLKLHEHLGTDEDWHDAYIKGGPVWLYLSARDLVMSYPEETRRLMVADVEEDDPQTAQEMARDILKVGFDGTGPSNAPALADELESKR